MGPLIVDIETAGVFDELPQSVQEYLVERENRRLVNETTSDDPLKTAIDILPLNPAAGIIVSIGMWLPEENKGAVLVNNAQSSTPTSKKFTRYNEQTAVFFGSESEILQSFWDKVIEKAGRGGRTAQYPIVTFNGRSFDGPFLMLRSAIHGIKPTRNLVGYRFSLQNHCDLQEVFSFMGSLDWKHRYSLDFWCSQFGIDSPKESMDGSQVGEVWHADDLDQLIEYSIADVKATAELYVKAAPLIGILMES